MPQEHEHAEGREDRLAGDHTEFLSYATAACSVREIDDPRAAWNATP